MLYLSQIIGQPILDRAGGKIASIKDIIILPGNDTYPSVTGLVARSWTREFFINWTQVGSLDAKGARLSSYKIDLQPFQRRGAEALLVRDVLDRQIIDTDDRRIVRANDVEMAEVNGQFRVVGVDVSLQALLRRLAPRGAVGGSNRSEVIDWADIEYLASEMPVVRLKVSMDRLAKLHPVEIARLVDSLSYHEGAEVLQSLDDETAADALEEMSPERQANIIGGMDEERAADILEEMEPDDAADLLGDLPEEKATELLSLMEKEESEEVLELLSYGEDTAGGAMTTDFTPVPKDFTAGQAIDYLRGLGDPTGMIYYLFVTESIESHKLVGIVTLRDLILSDPQKRLDEIMLKEFLSVHYDESALESARLMAEYNLLALPVVDESNEIQGIITADDAVNLLLPEDWQGRLPRVST
jgi:CBS domain-containing protein